MPRETVCKDDTTRRRETANVTDTTSSQGQVFVGHGKDQQAPTDTYQYSEGSISASSSGVRDPEQASPDEESDNGTDSDTVSSCSDGDHDFEDVAHFPDNEKEQELFWQYDRAEGRLRQCMRKPVCRVHRFFCKVIQRTGKGRRQIKIVRKRHHRLYCQSQR